MIVTDHTGRGRIHVELTETGAHFEVQDRSASLFVSLFLRSADVQRLATHLLSQAERAAPEPRCEA